MVWVNTKKGLVQELLRRLSYVSQNIGKKCVCAFMGVNITFSRVCLPFFCDVHPSDLGSLTLSTVHEFKGKVNVDRGNMHVYYMSTCMTHLMFFFVCVCVLLQMNKLIN